MQRVNILLPISLKNQLWILDTFLMVGEFWGFFSSLDCLEVWAVMKYVIHTLVHRVVVWLMLEGTFIKL